MPVTGGWETFTDVTGTLAGAPAGTTTLYLTFAGGAGLRCSTWTRSRSARRRPRPAPGRITGLGGKCLDVRGASSADGTKIQLWTCNGAANQQWTVDAGGTLEALGKCMDVTGGGTADGTQVQLWTCNGGAARTGPAQRRRHAAQPAVGQVPGRHRQQLRRRHPADHLDLPRRRQPEVDPALTARKASD